MANKDIDVRRESQSSGLLDPMSDMDSLFDTMAERFFGPRFGSMLSMGDWPAGARRGQTQLHETDKGYVLTAEIPGIPKENIRIDLNGNLLTIRAEHRNESQTEGNGFRRQYRSFNQSFSLPTSVDASQIEAHCENGLLEVMLPKTEQAQPKKIEAQSGKGGFLSRLMTKENPKPTGEEKGDAKH